MNKAINAIFMDVKLMSERLTKMLTEYSVVPFYNNIVFFYLCILIILIAIQLSIFMLTSQLKFQMNCKLI